MAWPCYYALAGTEIINAARVEAYAADTGWFVPVYRPHHLAAILGDSPYTDPASDDAPWYDSDVPDSALFYGIYPLSVDGLEDSTRSSTPIESVLDGGVPGRLRHGIRTGVFNVVLLAGSQGGADYGMRWLKSALLGARCGSGQATTNCFGDQLCYYAADPGDAAIPCTPDLPDVDLSDRFFRSLYKVVVNNGPNVTARHNTVNGGVVWNVQFTAVCGVPFEFGIVQPVVTGFLDPAVVDPAVGGGTVEATPHDFPEPDCAVPWYQPVVDPECPALISPPLPPTVTLDCYTPEANWDRRQFTIPADLLEEWVDAVVQVNVHAVTAPVRNLRLRFYQDPTGSLDPDTNPCGFCAEFVVTYVPEGGVLVLDGTVDTVAFLSAGSARRAEGLVLATDGSPFTWPVLDCGVGYVVTVDLPVGADVPYLDLSVLLRAS